MRHRRLPALLSSLFLSYPALALEVGQEVADVELRDGKSGNPSPIPDFGKKVLTLFYTDADVADMNDPLADALKERKVDLELHRGMGIVNLADSKAPNFIIRAVVKGKVEKYDSTILTDPDRLLAKQWGLTDVNNTSVIIVVGKDKKVHYLKRGAVRGEEIEAVVALVDRLIKS